MKMHLKIWIPGSKVTRRWLLRMNRFYLLLLCVTLYPEIGEKPKTIFLSLPHPLFFFLTSLKHYFGEYPEPLVMKCKKPFIEFWIINQGHLL